ncbi:MAG: DUF4465 domain-containing protein, partial [Spartobacteria bacterium]|nr:DUF4465 domain-containing protein [Spartobacteria bacterium]
MRRCCWFLLVPFLVLAAPAAQTTVSFDGLGLLPGHHVDNASYSTNAATFRNVDYGYLWAGFAFSAVSNVTLNWYTNQYAAAQGFPRAYAVGYHDDYNGVAPEIAFDPPAAPKSVLLNNTTYAALTVRDGNGYAQPFGSNDTFILTLTACDADGQVLAATNHYLADYRAGKTFVQTNWSQLDLSWMPPGVASLVGTLTTTDVGEWGPNTPTYFALADFTYAYSDGSDGIAATNPAILCWATGWTNYLPGPVLSNQYLNAENALGAAFGADGQTNEFHVTGLGDQGSITLTFPVPIADGPGPDFAVFENAFADTFLELAWCEVSSDGTNFVRFRGHCLATEPIADFTDPTAYGGFAGRHVRSVGTPFDLRLLAGAPGLDVRRVTHVRLTDVRGDGDTPDSYGNPIYDPTPEWGPGDFDLDAV